MFVFGADNYGEEVARILNAAGGGEREMPLVQSGHAKCAIGAAFGAGAELFGSAREPEAALAGLHLYLGNWDEAHQAADSVQRASNYYWHAIVHRQEPDAWNSEYWFRMTGEHPVFPAVRAAAERLGYDAGARGDPAAFVQYCEAARRRPGSDEEKLAMKVQLAEWQLLFDYCARDGKR